MTDQPNLYDWQPLVEGLAERRGRALEMGGPKLIERQRSQNKLPVRERIDLLLDPGTFVEFASGYAAMQECDTLLLLGTDFPYRQFFPEKATTTTIKRPMTVAPSDSAW